MLFIAEWEFSERMCQGFLKATDKKEAKRIIEEKLSSDCKLAEIREAKEHWITPQSITLNFQNTTQYELF